jgi:hypothetical protein
MLLLSVLSVFAVKILGFGGFCKQGKKSGGGGYCSKKMPLPRNYTEKKGKEPLSVIFANAEIHIYSKARMDPRIREGDQGANKKGMKAFSPRRRKGLKGRQEIRTCLLLLSGLRVFAVKILGDLPSKERHLPRINTELHGIRREIRAGSVSDGRQ